MPRRQLDAFHHRYAYAPFRGVEDVETWFQQAEKVEIAQEGEQTV
jgi:hypothetical protein